ncbi:MAG: phage tail protein, partial [Gemmatimonadales bacterium]
MSTPRVPLYERLPEIYRIKDEEQELPGQLRAYLGLIERAFGAIHENIEALYDDLFVETCNDWVIPYIGDLLGTSHLSGPAWTLRADVADTIPIRRRKGTLGAIELLVHDLTQWSVHCVELRENLAWHQHLNHQRPDAAGDPPYGLTTVTRFTVPRGGTAPVRDPATLSLLGTPFDSFAYVADVRPPTGDSLRINLPNLAIFLWRLSAYRVPITRPVSRGTPASA